MQARASRTRHFGPALAAMLAAGLCATTGCAQPEREEPPTMPTISNATPPSVPISGRVMADDYPSLQDAVNALGEAGGVVLLGPRRYELQAPLRLTRKVSLQGVMDAKVSKSSTVIAAAKAFQGEWLVETVAVAARENPDLNADLGFYDLNMVGSATVGGILAANVDILRIERCRLAYMTRCVNVTQVTDLPRPYPSRIAPGGLFINNCIFQASDICLNLEYSTQNRIFANWFVSNSGVVLRMLNSNKTWFLGNEINQFNRAGILLEDDGGNGNPIHNVFIAHNWFHSIKPDTAYIEVVNGTRMENVRVTDNIFSGRAGLRWPFRNRDRGNSLERNTGASARTEAIGKAILKAGETRAEIPHGLMAAPEHVAITPWGPGAAYWIEAVGEQRFAVHLERPLESDWPFSWEARVTP